MPTTPTRSFQTSHESGQSAGSQPQVQHAPAADVETLVDVMLEQAGLKNLPEDFLLTYRVQLMEQVEQRMGLLILAELSDADAQEYLNRFVQNEAPDPLEVQAFLTSRIESFEEKMKKGITELVQEFVQAAKAK